MVADISSSFPCLNISLQHYLLGTDFKSSGIYWLQELLLYFEQLYTAPDPAILKGGGGGGREDPGEERKFIYISLQLS